MASPLGSQPIVGEERADRRGAVLAGLLSCTDRIFKPPGLAADQFNRRFYVGIATLTSALVILYWAMEFWNDVGWFTKEDGLVEYGTAAVLFGGGTFAVLSARILFKLDHSYLGFIHLLLAIVFTVGALEEISWGQRIFGWGTPDAISEINIQNETTFHNIKTLETVIYTALSWISIAAIFGTFLRFVLHRQRRLTTADFILPGTITTPLLSLYLIWTLDALDPILRNLPYRTAGSEYGDLLLGLAVVLFGFETWRRALSYRHSSEATVT